MFTDAGPRRRFLLWFLIGTVAAAVLQIGQVRAMEGRPEGLLFAGDQQEVHVFVVDQLPETPVFEGYGHDGQIFYAVALDLRGEWVPDTLLSAPYRYRRIAFPAVASGFGLLDGQALLWGMILLSSIPVGVSAGALALIGVRLGLPTWIPATVVLNPATWLSARLLTADNLALAFALLGVLAFLNRRMAWTVAALAAAALTKEPYLAFAIGLAGYTWFNGERRRGAAILGGAAGVMVGWWALVWSAVGNPLDSGGNVVPPLVGLVGAFDAWGDLAPRDWLYLVAALTGVATSVWVVLRGRLLWAWLVGPWLLIAALSADLVWNVGNNAIRAFGPLLTLGIVGVVAGKRSELRPAHPVSISRRNLPV